MAFALAAGGVLLTAPAASATYSDCLDYTAQVGGDARGNNQILGCMAGAAGKKDECADSFSHANGEGSWKPTDEQTEAACAAAAVASTAF
ncbi:hypothetical protein [Streptomyces sp. NPDC092903]|uniref:hypothetical protein n=1 Tax=Streptomyces sp. NPDC092903 TaxID=3366017 RepID=UPI0037FE8F3A